MGYQETRNILTECVEEIEDMLQDIKDEIQALRCHRKNFDDLDECRTSSEKEEKDGSMNSRDYLASLIKESNKSMEKRITPLQAAVQDILKEIRNQKYSALCQETRWDKEDKDGVQDPPLLFTYSAEASQEKEDLGLGQEEW